MDKEKSRLLKKPTEPSIEIRTYETMSEEEYRAFERDMARRAVRQRKRARQIQENEDLCKAHYVYRKEYIYQFPYGIEASYPSGKYPIPEIAPDRRKRGRITSFTKKSKRRCRKALVSLDLPNGAMRYAVTLTLPWKIDDWGGDEVVADFNQAIETFRVAFARCFKHCAMIYRVEPQKSGAYHIHSIFYVPKDSTSWADDAYKYFEKIRKSKVQEIVDSGGMMPTQPDRCTTTDFLHKTFSLLWFNAIRRRISPESKIYAYWRVGVKVDVYTEAAQIIQVSKTIHYMINDDAKTMPNPIERKQWGFMQRRNLIEKKEVVEVHDRIRVLVLRDISRCKRNIIKYVGLPTGKKERYLFGSRHARRRNPVGIIIGITNDMMDKFITQAEQNVRARKMIYPKPEMKKSQMSYDAELAMSRYRSTPVQTSSNR